MKGVEHAQKPIQSNCCRIANILEQGYTVEGRHALAEHTGLPLEFVTSIVHRADIVRLPYVRHKTILPMCGAGYDTLAKIATADLAQMETDLETYFQRIQGKPWKNYKSVIVLKGMVAAARALPVIMEGWNSNNNTFGHPRFTAFR